MSKKKFGHFVDSFIYELEQTSTYCRERGVQFFKELDIGIAMDEYIAIDVISTNAGISQIDLAKLILKDRVFTSRLVNTLEQKGLITRTTETKGNRPIKALFITDEGQKIIDENHDKLNTQFLEVFKDLSDEDIENINLYMKKLKNCVSKYVPMKF